MRSCLHRDATYYAFFREKCVIACTYNITLIPIGRREVCVVPEGSVPRWGAPLRPSTHMPWTAIPVGHHTDLPPRASPEATLDAVSNTHLAGEDSVPLLSRIGGQRQPFSGPFHGARKMAVRSGSSSFRGAAVPSHPYAMADAPRIARRLPCNHSHKLVILSAAKDLSAELHAPPLLLYVQKIGLPAQFCCTYRFAIALWQHFPQLYVQKNGL